MTLYYEDETVQTVLGQVAQEMYYRFRGVTEQADLTQELWLWCARKSDRIEANMDKESFQPWLRTGLRNAARDYVAVVRNSADNMQDQEFYNLAQIELALPAVWDDDYLLGSGNAHDSKVSGGGDPSTGGNWMATCIDVRKAFGHLSNYYKELLRLRYSEGYYFSQIADHLGKPTTTAQFHVTQALKTIQRELGGAGPQKGRRKVVSNSHALAMTRNAYDGDN